MIERPTCMHLDPLAATPPTIDAAGASAPEPAAAGIAGRSILGRREFLRGATLGLVAPGLMLSAARAEATAPSAEPALDPNSVDLIYVRKALRRLFLVRRGEILRTYPIALGSDPTGHKIRQGDGRTPEGVYWIDRRNPQSQFYLSLGISFPNREDRARARSKGVSPGGDIFIHGRPNGRRADPPGDWTRGCIAVTNLHMREIWRAVPMGCQITIRA